MNYARIVRHDPDSKAAAADLASGIRQYWADYGAPVRVWVEEIEAPVRTGPKTLDVAPLFQVRSDMVNGMPRGFDVAKMNDANR